jgi:hypothetical protein
MPEGVEKQVDVQGMADLIAYLTTIGGPARPAEPARPQIAKAHQSSGWKAGVAKVNITPPELMWMSGYGGRDKPAEGKLTDLWAKALAIEDPRGERAVLVTLDLVGIDRETSLVVRNRLKEKHALQPRQIALSTSHTHCGPVVGRNLSAMYFLTERQQQQVTDYTARLETQLVDLVGEALANLAPAQLSWGQGRATFAVNRRNNKEAEVPQLRAAGSELKGPFDHDVPVLKVAAADGSLKAIVFGYACHATVLSFYQWCADYPGFAQMELEKAHPGATALFFAGCGADQNPLPRRTVELAQEYGRRLAQSVEHVLGGEMTPIAGGLATTYSEIPLPFAKLPTREELVSQTQDTNRYIARRATLLLAQVDGGKPLGATYPYPVQSWRLGPDLFWITLGGEVVVDYSLRLKRELGEKTWIAGYTNDVMAYIPSRRVLEEGGYEGGGAMVYYGLPSPWGPDVEELIIAEAKKQAAQTLPAGR